MRKKEDKTTSGFGVADGLDFGADIEETVRIEEHTVKAEPKKPTKTKPAKTETAEIDPNRSYSKYYTPKPKKGSKGGTLGRGSVKAEERKVQFSVTCTPAQKESFLKASEKEKRKLPQFICIAVEEYIKNHNL